MAFRKVVFHPLDIEKMDLDHCRNELAVTKPLHVGVMTPSLFSDASPDTSLLPGFLACDLMRLLFRHWPTFGYTQRPVPRLVIRRTSIGPELSSVRR
uniref:Uncharacterized protein n=1 Tax=Agrobacterium tumefaciens TaxID=358 RepID=A0A3S6I907_AGRTU|nr:hypothetical protein AgrTiEU6_210 [Agrobacterium tumefaciens]